MKAMKLVNGCELYKITDTEYVYYYSSKENHGPLVTIKKSGMRKWYYIRLNNVSVSDEYEDFEVCINVAYKDMVHSKY